MESGLEDRNNPPAPAGGGPGSRGLNGVRPRRPEQYGRRENLRRGERVSMESGLEDRNNLIERHIRSSFRFVSMESGLEDRNNAPPRPL